MKAFLGIKNLYLCLHRENRKKIKEMTFVFFFIFSKRVIRKKNSVLSDFLLLNNFKTLRNCSPYFYLFVGSGQVNLLRQPGPTLTSPTYTRWAKIAWSITFKSIPFTFEGHSYKQMGHATMRTHLQFRSYKLIHLLGIIVVQP